MMSINKKRSLFGLFTVFLVILFIEIVLNLFAVSSSTIESVTSLPSHTVPDDRLGYRPNPKYPGHDRKGFRNPRVPIEVDIVALGDSQTYGSGVEPQAAWPSRLNSMLESTVYGMAFGGYGPVHSLILLDEAVDLQPRIIIEALYAGNDLYDSFNLVYNRGEFPELKTNDLVMQKSIRTKEESESIVQRVSRMVGMRTFGPNDESFSLRPFLSRYSKLYGLLRQARFELLNGLRHNLRKIPRLEWEVAKRFADSNSEYCQAFDDGKFRTIFTSEYCLTALDLQDPRIAEGHRISLKAIRRMNDLAVTRGIRFIVVLIPTKEFVFRDLVRNPTESFRNLSENEYLFRKITVDFLERTGIEYVDVLPALREQLSAGNQPYPVSHDGHPNEFGHEAIAALIKVRIKQDEGEITLTSPVGSRIH